ncbi:hypothetical protein KAR91_33375 [Candidatus Pacearchaeota archaeon]|nr:hypothetical protein [Candidatus Pacearchaeota archaeon]
MKKHVMALTYPPKIEAVRNGECTQTIRIGERVAVGDSILFHGWEGKPYRSKWDWRKRVVVTEVIPVCFSYYGMHWIIEGNDFYSFFEWGEPVIDKLAMSDNILPPTGWELRKVLFKLNGGIPLNKPEKYQIIRWRVTA